MISPLSPPVAAALRTHGRGHVGALGAQLATGALHAAVAAAAALAVRRFLVGESAVFPLLAAAAASLGKLLFGAGAARIERRWAAEVETALRVLYFRGGLEAVREGRATPDGLASLLVEDVRLLTSELVLPRLLLPRRLAALLPLVAVGLFLVPRAAPFALLPVLLVVAVVGLFRRTVRQAAQRAARLRTTRTERILDRARHALLFAAFGKGALAEAAFQKEGAALAAVEGNIDALAVALSGANELLALIAVLLFGALSGPTVLRELLPALVPLFLAYRPIKELAETRLEQARGRLREERLRPFLPTSPMEDVPKDPCHKVDLSPLVLRGVKPAYARFESVDAAVSAGEIVAICGPTGVGKSSLLCQMLGLSAGEGRIEYAGSVISLNGLRPEDVFAWLPQEAPVFAGTVTENLFEEPWPLAVLRPTGLSQGDVVGTGGRALSGGERQWISLARAVASGAPVLLLDEPTASLDSASEAAFLQWLLSLRGHRTVILTTHRPTTAQVADRIIELGVAHG